MNETAKLLHEAARYLVTRNTSGVDHMGDVIDGQMLQALAVAAEAIDNEDALAALDFIRILTLQGKLGELIAAHM